MFSAEIKAIVFDLDGTLYEDTDHFDYYAGLLRKRFSERIGTDFLRDYKSCLAGDHSLRIGRIYDTRKELILVIKGKEIKEAYNWDGLRIQESEIKKLYPKPPAIDMEACLSIGDLWWVPAAIARHYGLGSEEIHEAFLETRDYMMTEEFRLTQIPGLKETLMKLAARKKLVLLTNSPEKDSEAILEKLELGTYFHRKYFDGRKPLLTVQHFNEIKELFSLRFENILSVGDNYLNEISPAVELGARSIFIDPHGIGDDVKTDFKVSSIQEALPILESL